MITPFAVFLLYWFVGMFLISRLIWWGTIQPPKEGDSAEIRRKLRRIEKSRQDIKNMLSQNKWLGLIMFAIISFFWPSFIFGGNDEKNNKY